MAVGTNTVDQYTLRLVDQILGPLRAIEKQAGAVHETMQRMEKLVGQGLGLAKIAGAAGLALGGLELLKKGVEGIIGLFEKGVEGVLEFGKAVIEATRFRTQNISALELFLGKGQGEATFNRALDFGKYLPMDERDVVRQVRELAGAGYQGKQLEAVNAALADVQALQGDAARENLTFHFKRLKNEAAPDARDVKMAAIDTGVGMAGLFKQLYAGMGMALPKNADTTAGLFAMSKQYDAWKKAGQISGNDVANAILRAISEKYDAGGQLGGAAVQRGESTLSGLLTNLQAAPERFLMQMRLENMPGIRALMDFIKRLLPFFDHSTEAGKKLTRVIEDIINTLFGGLDKIGENDLAAFFDSAVKVAERFVSVLHDAWEFVDKMLHGNFGDLLEGAMDVILEVGKLLGYAVYQGFKAAWKGGFDPTASIQTYRAQAAYRYRLQHPDEKGAVADTQLGVTAVHGEKEPGSIEKFLGAGSDTDDLKKAGEEYPRAVRKGMDDASERHSPPRLFVEAGEEYVDALLAGIARRAREIREGGGAVVDGRLDDLLEQLRGIAHRTGAKVVADG